MRHWVKGCMDVRCRRAGPETGKENIMHNLGWVAFAVIAGILAGCTVRGQGVDAPIDVGADYRAREAAMMQDGDRCGPKFIQDNLPASVQRVIAPLADGPFRPVCARHDACYRLAEQNQAWCDDRMRAEMLAVCTVGNSTATYSIPGIGASLCRFHAGMYYAAINNTYGAFAHGGEAGGEITAVRATRIREMLGTDELVVCVDVHNPTQVMQEYDVELHDGEGKLIDREPDLHERNVRAAETEEFCVGTNFNLLWDIENIGETVYVSIRADTPNSFEFNDDMVIVDTRSVEVPN